MTRNSLSASHLAALFHARRERIASVTDRWFAALFIAQWLAEFVIAIFRSMHSGSGAQTHPPHQTWTIAFLGAVIASVALLLLRYRPGRPSTHHAIAAAQGLTAVILIYLSGAWIDASWYIFVSLALLAFYRDGRMLAIATAIVLGDRLVRGVFWPEAVNGASLADPWGFLEYAAWLITADVILYLPGRQSLLEARRISLRRAHWETRNEEVATSNIQLRAEVAELQRTQRTLEVAKEFAEAANRAQNEFLSSVAHELRSPLNAVIGFSDVLSQQIVGSLNEDQMQCVTDILESGRCLLGLISDVLDVAKIEAASTNFELAAVSLEPLVERRDSNVSRTRDSSRSSFGRQNRSGHRRDRSRRTSHEAAYLQALDRGFEVRARRRGSRDRGASRGGFARFDRIPRAAPKCCRAIGIDAAPRQRCKSDHCDWHIGAESGAGRCPPNCRIARWDLAPVESPEDGQIRFVVTLPHAAIDAMDDGPTLAAVGPLADDRPVVE